MNFNEIIKLAEDPEIFEQKGERRELLKGFGSKVLAASLPLALGSLFTAKKASGQNINAILDTMNFALKLEYLGAEFYKTANNTAGLIPAEHKAFFEKIAADEASHVGALQYYIGDLGGTPISSPTFDFTGGSGHGGPFPKVFSDFDSFLEVAQILKDTVIRAYKYVMTNVMPQDRVLYTVMNIHSVEARHSAHIRFTRDGVRPWIQGNNSNSTNPASVKTYAGEQNTTQVGINMVNINGYAINAAAASGAFDEPLTDVETMVIINNFIV